MSFDLGARALAGRALTAASPTGFLNWTPSLILPKQFKLGKAMSATAACLWNLSGDSTAQCVTGGAGVSSTSTTSMAYRAYLELLRRGIPARYDGCSAATKISNYDARWSGSGLTAFSGYLLNCTGLGSNVQTFTPTETSDTFVVTWLDLAAAGTLRVKCNGGANQDVATTNAGIYKSSTFTGTLGANPWTFEGSAGVYIFHVHAYNSAIKDVRVVNTGVPGIAARDQNTATSNCPLNGQVMVGGDIHTTVYGINDSTGGSGSNGGGTYVSQYGAGLARILAAFTAAKTIVIGPNYNMSISDAIIDTYRAQFLTAIGTTFPAYDMRLRLGGTNAAVVATGLQTDDLHPTSSLYDYNARLLVSKLLDAC